MTSDMLKEKFTSYFLENNFKEDQDLLEQAYQEKIKHVGRHVHLRGIIEFSNYCIKNCYYCGIRQGNGLANRYTMGFDEIIESARWACEHRYGSIVLQSGERQDAAYVDFVERIIKTIKAIGSKPLGITLSCGEQSVETYQRWHQAGADRYLLRIETSNPQLYQTLHPENHDFVRRCQCLKALREIGYQVGTGVMIGLPDQTADDLLDDILFFKKMDIDMIGMGPYIVHQQTPLGQGIRYWSARRQLQWGLKMIAITRLILKDVNIAATTALQSLAEDGREQGLLAGANIIMPNITPIKYRKSYQLYDDKPCVDENSSMCRSCLEKRIDRVSEDIAYDEWGDSPHFFNRKKEKN